MHGKTPWHVFVEGFQFKPVPVSFDSDDNLESPEKRLSVEGLSRPHWPMDVFTGQLLTIDWRRQPQTTVGGTVPEAASRVRIRKLGKWEPGI